MDSEQVRALRFLYRRFEQLRRTGGPVFVTSVGLRFPVEQVESGEADSILAEREERLQQAVISYFADLGGMERSTRGKLPFQAPKIISSGMQSHRFDQAPSMVELLEAQKNPGSRRKRRRPILLDPDPAERSAAPAGLRGLQATPLTDPVQKEEWWLLTNLARGPAIVNDYFDLAADAQSVLGHMASSSERFRLQTQAHNVGRTLWQHWFSVLNPREERGRGQSRVDSRPKVTLKFGHWTVGLLHTALCGKLPGNEQVALHAVEGGLGRTNWVGPNVKNDQTSLVRYVGEKHDHWVATPFDVLSASLTLLQQLLEALGVSPAELPDARTAVAQALDAVPPDTLEPLQENRDNADPARDYVGESLPILRMFDQIYGLNKRCEQNGNMQRGPAPVLLLGPSGVGKTQLAELVWRTSRRSVRKIAYQTASDILGADEAVIRSNWAGYGKGAAVSGADPEGKAGLLSDYDGGTIFLDEVQDCPAWFQQFLFRVLDGKSISPAAGTGESAVRDVRFIFASNLRVDQLRQTLRHDFWKRIAPYVVEVPSLKDRREDILCFIRKWAEGRPSGRNGSEAEGTQNEEGNGRMSLTYFDARLLLAMLRYDWPDEVRELGQFIEEAVGNAGNERPITPDHLDPRSTNSRSIRALAEAIEPEQAEKELLMELTRLLERMGFRKRQRGAGLQKEMAKFLGYTEGTLSKKLSAFGLS